MDYIFLMKCYVIGVLGNLTMGPIFMLTLKRSVRAGFWHGFATAISAAIADGFLFLLGMFGVLSLVDELPFGRATFLLVGGSALLYVGIKTFREKHSEEVALKSQESIVGILGKTFIFTIINPGTLLYFMAASVSILDENLMVPFTERILMSSMMISLGTISVLGLVCIMAGSLGKLLNKKPMEYLTKTIGILFIGLGLFFYYQAILRIIVHLSTFFAAA